MNFSEFNFNVGSFMELREKWRAEADALIPVLQHRQVVPESLAELVDDPEAWQVSGTPGAKRCGGRDSADGVRAQGGSAPDLPHLHGRDP